MTHFIFSSNDNSRNCLYVGFVAAIILLLGSAAAGQQDEGGLRTETSLVQLNVGVVDRQGRAITSLSRNDFTVYEDGVKQTIQTFEPTETPFSLVILLDMSGSTINFRQQL